jgi:hypothetical protein
LKSRGADRWPGAVSEGKAVGPERRTFVFVTNRLEGNAISSIAAMLEPDEG